MANVNTLQRVIKAKVNNLEFESQELTDASVIHQGESSFLIVLEGQCIGVTMEHSDHARQYVLTIEQKKYTVSLEREIDGIAKAMGFDLQPVSRSESILAPMPGMVKKVLVTLGEEVVKGQNLINLEAMKMENILKSPHAGKIKSILVTAGTAVEKSQVLITF